MVRILTVERHDVHADPRLTGEGFEEVAHEVGLDRPHRGLAERPVLDIIRPPAAIYRDMGQRLVHRDGSVRCSANAAMVAQRVGNCLSEADADILNGVVGVHIQIAVGVNDEVELTVAREEGQEVVQRAEAGPDIARPASVEVERERDRCLGRPALDRGTALRHVR